MQIFIIDDDQIILDLYEHVFQQGKHETETAHDGVEAFMKLDRMKKLPDAIVLDIMMPRMNGFDFLKKLKDSEKYRDIPVIILSNLYSRPDRQKGIDLGAAKYLVKSEHDPNEIVGLVTDTAQNKSA